MPVLGLRQLLALIERIRGRRIDTLRQGPEHGLRLTFRFWVFPNKGTKTLGLEAIENPAEEIAATAAQ